MTKRQLLSEITHQEFLEWQAYYTMEPWGTEPSDRRAALVCSTMANIHRPRRSTAARIDQFMPKYGKNKRQSWQEQLAISKQWCAAVPDRKG